MAPDRAQALQDTFLDHLRKHEVPVTMFLTNGVRLQGYVGRFDSYSVLLVRDRQAQPSCPASRFGWSSQANKKPLKT
jgi:host factor-I protein